MEVILKVANIRMMTKFQIRERVTMWERLTLIKLWRMRIF